MRREAIYERINAEQSAELDKKREKVGLDSIAVSLFGNMTVETGEIRIIRTKDPNNHSDTETGTLSRWASPWW